MKSLRCEGVSRAACEPCLWRRIRCTGAGPVATGIPTTLSALTRALSLHNAAGVSGRIHMTEEGTLIKSQTHAFYSNSRHQNWILT